MLIFFILWLMNARKMRTRISESFFNCLYVFGFIIHKAMANDQTGEKSSTAEMQAVQMQSGIATAIFLLFFAALFTCIWCSCCMNDLYNTTSLTNLKKTESEYVWQIMDYGEITKQSRQKKVFFIAYGRRIRLWTTAETDCLENPSLLTVSHGTWNIVNLKVERLKNCKKEYSRRYELDTLQAFNGAATNRILCTSAIFLFWLDPPFQNLISINC